MQQNKENSWLSFLQWAIQSFGGIQMWWAGELTFESKALIAKEYYCCKELMIIFMAYFSTVSKNTRHKTGENPPEA